MTKLFEKFKYPTVKAKRRFVSLDNRLDFPNRKSSLEMNKRAKSGTTDLGLQSVALSRDVAD